VRRIGSRLRLSQAAAFARQKRRFKPSLILTISDRTTLLAEGGNVELKNDKAAVDFNAADK
jgi:hypothetical protein